MLNICRRNSSLSFFFLSLSLFAVKDNAEGSESESESAETEDSSESDSNGTDSSSSTDSEQSECDSSNQNWINSMLLRQIIIVIFSHGEIMDIQLNNKAKNSKKEKGTPNQKQNQN